MELFIKVYFWLAIIGTVCRLLCIGFVDYPRETSRSEDSLLMLTGLPFLIWAAILYGNNW